MLLAEIVQLLQRIGPIETSVMVSAKKGFFRGWRREALRIMVRQMTAAQTANLRIAEAPIWRENYIELTFDRRLSSNH